MMKVAENSVTVHGGKHRELMFACNLCGKEDRKQKVKTQIESNHMTRNISHSCNISEKMSRSSSGLRMHKVMEHS